MVTRGETVTGLVAFAPGHLIRAVGRVQNVFSTYFFAQLRSPINGQTYNSYFVLADEGTTWLPGDQSGDSTLTSFGSFVFSVETIDDLATYDDAPLITSHAFAHIRAIFRNYWLEVNSGNPDDRHGAANFIDAPSGRQWIGE